MESKFAGLSLDEEEEEILQVQDDSVPVSEEEILSLVGCFLTASIIHYQGMKSTMANLWHPVRGVQIRDLGEKRYLFKFFHIIDMERVINGAPWTFNNHMLIFHKLQGGEDPLKVPLVSSPFWVQVHGVPIWFYSENLAMQLGNFIGIFQDYDGSSLGKENMNFMRIRVQVDIQRPLRRKNHNDSFCEAKMEVGAEVNELGWDLSLRAPSRRAQAMSSVWLREEGGSEGGMNKRGTFRGNRDWDIAMEHDLENEMIIGEEGKK
ncbi:hypothetical protein Goari_020339, partial [Gossypium aridum]|nr:hypothetical protein [Gossypium aridum]